ncbi:signal recognition particle-docking protein FtsY [Candidatus Bathyarchaeota archaeon]|nr:signal recognition particle-docking protein FtsY [Candidatus Bathyarchaeota archaeon]
MLEGLRKTFSSFIEKLSSKELGFKELQPVLEELKLSLVRNDVAYTVAEEICGEIAEKLSGVKVGRFEDVKPLVKKTLRQVLLETLKASYEKDFLETVKAKVSKGEPAVILFVGVNGSGKTLTIAKVARLLLGNGFTVCIACSDTFRAGAIEQVEILAKRLGVRAIKQAYGSDAAAVAYDAVQYARAHGINVVLIDTAGRMQTRKNLMEEMRKIARVTNPDLVVFVGDSLTGNDAVNQAEEFMKYVGIDFVILTKMDADAKGGAAISISKLIGRPVAYIGTGQDLEDLKPFNPEEFVDKIVV